MRIRYGRPGRYWPKSEGALISLLALCFYGKGWVLRQSASLFDDVSFQRDHRQAELTGRCAVTPLTTSAAGSTILKSSDVPTALNCARHSLHHLPRVMAGLDLISL
jgi:hypothetical protein